MGFEPPIYSKNQVNRAGDVLANRKKENASKKNNAMDVLSNWRVAHAYPINTFQATLRSRLNKIDHSALVGQRLKRTPSIIEKLNRFKTMKLAQMQDIGGLRAVLSSISKVRKLEDVYRSPRFTHELVDWDDYINNPKQDGYRGLHLIFKYRSTNAVEYNNLLIELQLRTAIQHAWATAVETMDIFTGQSLKLGKGTRKWKRFFKYTSMAFSILENSAPVPGFSKLTKRKIFQEVRKMNAELKVLDKLKGFSIATNMVLKESGVGVYNLITLNLDENYVRIQRYPKNSLNEANKELTRLETKYIDNGDVDVVLVSAGPLKQLQKSYPNYFLDTDSFIRKVEKVIALSRRADANLPGASIKDKYKKIAGGKSEKTRNILFSGDIPQADNLDSVRKVVEVISYGEYNLNDICTITGYSPRHVQYKINAAVILGFLDKIEDIKITNKGKMWLYTESASREESLFLMRCIEETKVFNLVAKDIFSHARPDKVILARRIMDYANLSESTAFRRASTLVAWSKRILQYYIPNVETRTVGWGEG